MEWEGTGNILTEQILPRIVHLCKKLGLDQVELQELLMQKILSNTSVSKKLIINLLNFIFAARSVHWLSLVERHTAIVLSTSIMENVTNIKHEILGVKGTKPSY